MRDYYKSISIDPFIALPLTFVINDGLNDPEFDKFEEHFKKIQEENAEKPNGL